MAERVVTKNVQGDYIALSLTEEQTIDNLMVFSDQITKVHDDYIVPQGWCDCGKEQPKEEEIMATIPQPEGWDSSWGEPSDYNITDETELDGFIVGEQIRVIEDDEHEGLFSGDEGLIVGIARTGSGIFNPDGKVELIVAFEMSSPLGVSTDNAEPVD